MAKIFLVVGESGVVPGRITKACQTAALADIEAASLVNILLDEVDLEKDATADNWREKRKAYLRQCVINAGDDPDEVDEWKEDGDVWIEEVDFLQECHERDYPDYDSSRNVSDDEIEQWAMMRADDAGFLARKLLSDRRRMVNQEMFVSHSDHPAPKSHVWGGPETSPDLYRTVHDAATAVYEASTPADYRYSASALRQAVDAGIRAALASEGQA